MNAPRPIRALLQRRIATLVAALDAAVCEDAQTIYTLAGRLDEAEATLHRLSHRDKGWALIDAMSDDEVLVVLGAPPRMLPEAKA